MKQHYIHRTCAHIFFPHDVQYTRIIFLLSPYLTTTWVCQKHKRKQEIPHSRSTENSQLSFAFSWIFSGTKQKSDARCKSRKKKVLEILPFENWHSWWKLPKKTNVRALSHRKCRLRSKHLSSNLHNDKYRTSLPTPNIRLWKVFKPYLPLLQQ